MRRGHVIGLLLLVLLAAVPLAYASPPDQSWLGGWFDDDDFDNIVVFITSTVAALDHRPVILRSALLIVLGFVGAAATSAPTSIASSPFQGRAPPHF